MIPEEFLTQQRIARLLRTATAVSRDAAMAEDIVQEVLAKACARWDRISTADDPDAYLGRMLVNEHLSWRRRWTRAVPTADVHLSDVQPDFTERHAERDRLKRMINKLPPKQQVALTLRYSSGLSDGEIAYIMDCRTSTVSSYISRALATLRASDATPLTMERNNQ